VSFALQFGSFAFLQAFFYVSPNVQSSFLLSFPPDALLVRLLSVVLCCLAPAVPFDFLPSGFSPTPLFFPPPAQFFTKNLLREVFVRPVARKFPLHAYLCDFLVFLLEAFSTTGLCFPPPPF